MNTEKTFQTKTGYYHITADKITFTKHAIVGKASKMLNSGTSKPMLFIFTVLSFVTLFNAYYKFQKEELFFSILFVIMGFF